LFSFSSEQHFIETNEKRECEEKEAQQSEEEVKPDIFGSYISPHTANQITFAFLLPLTIHQIIRTALIPFRRNLPTRA